MKPFRSIHHTNTGHIVQLTVCLSFLFLMTINQTLAQSITKVIRGTVTTSSATTSRGLNNVLIQTYREGLLLQSVQTDQDGKFLLRITIPTTTTIVTLKASRAGWKFYPDSLVVSITGAADTIIKEPAFVAKNFAVSGTVLLPSTSANYIQDFPRDLTVLLKKNTGEKIDSTIPLLLANTPSGDRKAEFRFTNISNGEYILEPIFKTNNLPRVRFVPALDTILVEGDSVVQRSFTMIPMPTVVTGRITSTGTLGLRNTLVKIQRVIPSTPPVSLTVLSRADGYYTAEVATAGTYLITPSLSGYNFSPAVSEQITITPQDSIKSGGNFQATAQQFSVKGTIVYDDEKTGYFPASTPIILVRQISGLEPLSLSPIDSKLISQGQDTRYEFDFFAPNGKYEIRIILNHVAFSRDTITFDVQSGETILPIITAKPKRYTVNGQVNGQQIVNAFGDLGANRIFLQNIEIVVTAAESGRFFTLRDTTKGAQSQYSVEVPFGRYIISASGNSQYDIVSPISQRIIESNTTINFSAQPKSPRIVSGGKIEYQKNNRSYRGVPGVVVKVLADGVEKEFRSNNTGEYVMPALSDVEYRVTPSLPGHVFTPTSRIFRTSDLSIPGFVVSLAPTKVIGSVKMLTGETLAHTNCTITALTGESKTAIKKVILDSSGTYTMVFTSTIPGDEFFLIPELQGYKFGPMHRTIVTTTATSQGLSSLERDSIIIENQNFRALTTTAGITLSSISGRIIWGSPIGPIPVPGILISDGTRSATTDSLGRYIIYDVPNGEYVVTPILPEWFPLSPPRENVRIEGLRPATDINWGVITVSPINRTPVVSRIAGNGTLNVQAGRISVFQSSSVQPFFTDPDSDPLTFTTTIEDPTIARARCTNNALTIEPLFAGNTVLRVYAIDGQGGVTSATYRVVVAPPADPPTELIPVNKGLNTHHNAAIIIPRSAIQKAVFFSATKAQNSGSILAGTECVELGDELGALNEKDELVGSVRISGEDNVLTVWSEEPVSGLKGMSVNSDLKYVVNRRKTRTVRGAYILSVPAWPIDRGVIDKFECETTEITAVEQRRGLVWNIYPNPVSDKTTIDYILPEAANVKIELVNMYGQAVQTLMDTYQVSGHYKIHTACNGFPAGMYHCRLQVGSLVLWKRVVLIR